MPEIIDISLPIKNGMPVYPGTAQTNVTEVKSGSGDNILSEIFITSHTGTHIDAPSHSLPNSKHTIDSYDLSVFYGPARVLDLTGVLGGIRANDLQEFSPKAGERLLFKTSNSLRGFSKFNEDYVYLTSEAAQYLAGIEVLLVGIDSLGIKQKGSPDNRAHTSLLEKEIAILEGLDLSGASPGNYTLCAMPLKLSGRDGAPCRAILLAE